MPPDMRVQTVLLKGVLGVATIMLATGFLIGEARAQALLVEKLPGGTQLVLVSSGAIATGIAPLGLRRRRG